MPSALVSRNITVSGRRTSMRLEPAMWDALTEICRHERCRLGELVSVIDQRRGPSSLTAAVRVFLLDYFRLRAQPQSASRQTAMPSAPPMFGPE